MWVLPWAALGRGAYFGNTPILGGYLTLSAGIKEVTFEPSPIWFSNDTFVVTAYSTAAACSKELATAQCILPLDLWARERSLSMSWKKLSWIYYAQDGSIHILIMCWVSQSKEVLHSTLTAWTLIMLIFNMLIFSTITEIQRTIFFCEGKHWIFKECSIHQKWKFEKN